ncbi:MAG: M20/M25/M40 family metallo-hydrolase [Planctomycetota bacterium]
MIKTLTDLTGLPTAAGREDAVIAWVRRWAKRRPWASLEADQFGNLSLRDRAWRRRKSREPVVLVAHMDHPAFVAESCDGRDVVARFRGGVRESYFVGSAVRHWRGTRRGVRGKVAHYTPDPELGPAGKGPIVAIRMAAAAKVRRGDVFTWDVPGASMSGGRLRAPACDNLGGVAAALSALERTHRAFERGDAELRVLLTRAEEVGFVGALGVCETRDLPEDARVVVLEASKAFDHAPIGGGPIVRVGDRVSVFDATLTYDLATTAQHLEKNDKTFTWQRKLMDGGACEATVFVAYGYRAACVCVPLGNYHNMNEVTGQIDREHISVNDWRGMVQLLAELLRDNASRSATIRDRLAERFVGQRGIVSSEND